jgi:general secretion pathway protein B
MSMSYILDALKKSEQQRQRGAAPSLLAAQAADVAPRRPLTLVYGLAAGVILVVGVAIGTLRPWRTQAPAVPQPVLKPPEAVAPAAPPASPSVAITINTERQTAAPAPATPPGAVSQPAPATQPVPTAQSAPATQPAAVTQPAAGPAGGAMKAQSATPASPAQGVPPVSTTAPQSNVSSPPPANPTGARPADVAPERSPVPFAELPASIQRDIPKLAILFHLYSRNPKERLVGINDRTLHEGDTVAPGLVVDEITPDGMVLSYKGYRFLHGTR